MFYIVEQYPYLKDFKTMEEFSSKFESDPMLYQEMKDLYETVPAYAWRVKYLNRLGELVKTQNYDVDALVKEYPFMSDYKAFNTECLIKSKAHKSLRKEISIHEDPSVKHRYAVLKLEETNTKRELHYTNMHTDPVYAAEHNEKVKERQEREVKRQADAKERHVKLLEEMKTNPLAGIEALANLDAARSFVELGEDLFNQREDLFKVMHENGILVKRENGKFDFVKSEHRHHYRKSILNF